MPDPFLARPAAVTTGAGLADVDLSRLLRYLMYT